MQQNWKPGVIEEAPVCRVKEIVFLGSHDMVQADDRFLEPETEKFELDRAHPLVCVYGGYCDLGEKIGKVGWSVEKKKKKNIR